MKLLKDYFTLQKQIYDYFGYTEQWMVISLDDATEFYWFMEGEVRDKVMKSNSVYYAEEVENLHDEERGDRYHAAIFTYCHLTKFVYQTPEYTMVCVDTQCDGNKFLMVFDNEKYRAPKPELEEVE